tara:strand:+ start:56 stop:919 length:864 start_codon:yes stop_codon:yes gene_type:complete
MEYKRAVDNQKDMSVNYERIVSSLEIFLKQNGHYPCPADITKSIGDSGFGDEGKSGSSCGGTGINPANNMYRGGIPTAALNLPYRLAGNHDGWKLQYVVDKAQTAESTYNGNGNIDIVDRTSRPVSSDVVYVLVDPGMDGKGSRSMSGASGPACGTAADSENCDPDNQFRDWEKTDIFDTGSSEYYDDTIYFHRPREDAGFWMTQSNPGGLTGLNIVNRNSGNIGIGQDAPSEKLDIGGDVMVDSDPSSSDPSVEVDTIIKATDIDAKNEVIINQGVYTSKFTYGVP